MKKRNNGQKRCRAASEAWLITMLLVLPLLSISCGLLSKNVVLHPIQQSDIILLKAGDNFTAPQKGAFLSDMYIQEVMEAKVK